MRYKTRLYGGGQQTAAKGTRSDKLGLEVRGNGVDAPYGTMIYEPMAKGMAPLKSIRLASTSDPVTDEDNSLNNPTRVYSAQFEITDTVIKSLTWPKGDGSKIQDQISSAECKNITLTIYTDKATYDPTGADPAHKNLVANTENMEIVKDYVGQ